MNRAELIIELLKTLNMGNTYFYNDRVKIAIEQYDQLVKNGIIKKEKDPILEKKYVGEAMDKWLQDVAQITNKINYADIPSYVDKINMKELENLRTMWEKLVDHNAEDHEFQKCINIYFEDIGDLVYKILNGKI